MELVNGLYKVDVQNFADPYGNGLERFDKLSEYVQRAVKGLGDNTVSAIEVAKALYHIRELELYKGYPVPGSDGKSVFQDFNSFCAEIFKAKKSTIYNYIALYKRFGAVGGLSTELPPNFNVSDYTYTQLLLMSDLSAAELLEIKPDWTCSRIKNHIKMKKEGKADFSNQLENDEMEIVEDVPGEELEAFRLNNDKARADFLQTYQRWNKCAEVDVVNTHVVFYSINLDYKVLVAVNTTSKDVFDAVSYYLFCPTDQSCNGFGLHGTSHLDMRWDTSIDDIINFLRDRKIKSIDIKKV